MRRMKNEFWEYFWNDDHNGNSPDITGKYLFFSQDRDVLVLIAEKELKQFFYHAKISNNPVNGEFVLCIYHDDASKKYELAAKYRDSQYVKYRYWKSDADTRAGIYSEKFLKGDSA